MMNMMKDNPAYFQALKMYKNYQQEKTNRIAKDGVIITGGLLTTFTSGGIGTGAYMAAFGVTSGVFAIGAGTTKMIVDAMGKFKEADQIPTSPLGGVGKAIDALKGGGDLTYQNVGDVATAVVSLLGGEWTEWGAMESAERLSKAQEILGGLYELGNRSVDAIPHNKDMK